MEVNTRLLREEFGWHGNYLDGGEPNAAINLHHAFFNASNIASLMRTHGASEQLALLSVDCDFDDFFVLREILLAGFEPRVLVAEYTPQFMLNQARSACLHRAASPTHAGRATATVALRRSRSHALLPSLVTRWSTPSRPIFTLCAGALQQLSAWLYPRRLLSCQPFRSSKPWQRARHAATSVALLG